MKKTILALTLATMLGACASSPDDLPAASVSTIQYQSHSCRQIAVELDRVQRKANNLYYRLDKKASDDSAQMAVGMLLLWPTLFFLEGGDGPEAAEYSQLRGEMEALETVAIRKKCGIDFPEPPSRPKTPTANEARKNFNE